MNRRLFVSSAVIALAGCSHRRRQKSPFINIAEIQERRRTGDPVIRVACVGDSITAGAGIPEPEKNSYPAQLGEMLKAKFLVRNFGRSGATLLKSGDLPYWTTDEFKGALGFDPDVVIIALGTNDTKPQNWRGKADFKRDYAALLDQFRLLKSKPKIWACLPVPVYAEMWGINPEKLDEAIECIQEVTDKAKVPVIDLNDALTGHPEMFPDKIHPDVRGAELMAKTVYQAIRP
jgi:lysophospholipase L1-like esterase